MKFFTKTTMLAFTAAFIMMPLAACEHYSEGSTAAKNSETVPAPMSNLDSAPGVRSVPQFPVPNDRDLKVMTSKLSGGSVEIYDVDSGMPQTQAMGAPVPPVQPDYIGIPMATDPSVTIYPLDGYAAYPGDLRPAPMMAGGGREWPNSILPVGKTYDSAMTPPPDSFGGDQPMAIEGGKLAPRVGTTVSNVYFKYGSARLDGSDKTALGNVAEAAKFAPVDRVSIEGHASAPTQTNDPVKSKILNLKESMNRTNAVSQELIQRGVPAEKIKAVAWGDTKPSGGSEAAQRRVDIYTAAP